MIQNVKINSNYKNVFTGDLVTVINIDESGVQYLKHKPTIMRSCDIPNPREIEIMVKNTKGKDELVKIQIGKVVESKRITKIQEHLLYPQKGLSIPSKKIDYVLNEFIKPLKVFNQTYTDC